LIPFSTSKGVSLAGAGYALGVEGPTDEPAIDFNPTSSLLGGYFLEVPYSKVITVTPVTPPTPPTPPPPPKTEYLYTWGATWSRTFNGDDLLTRFDDSPYMYQGTYDGVNGNYRSVAGFNWSDIIARLSGAEILEVFFTLENKHWRWNAGEAIQLGTTNYVSKPSSWNSSNVWTSRWSTWFNYGQRKNIWVDPSVGYEFKSGASKGIAIGPGRGGSVPNADYGYFYGATHSQRPLLTIRYRK
jgi:hypothetical protein